MALLKFGGGVTEMTGALGGNVFARNRSGHYVRAKTVPVNPNSSLQQNWRAAVAFLVNRWNQTLTAAQRTAWNLYGSSVPMKNRLGETIYLTGFNHYIRSNAILKAQALTLVDDGPTTFTLPEQDPSLSFSASEATGNLTVTYDDTLPLFDEDDAFMFVFAGSPQVGSKQFFRGPWKYADKVAGDSTTPPSSPATISHPCVITEGQALWIYARLQRADGRISEKFYEGPTLAGS